MEVEHNMNPTGRGFRVPMPWSKRYVYPEDPRPEDFYIEDVAHKLAMSCRYGGGTSHFYSTAEHCCHLFDWFRGQGHSSERQRSALVHDRAEAWLQDFMRPLKQKCAYWYLPMEVRIEQVSAPVFHVPFPNDPVVMEADYRICIDEKLQAYWDGGFESENKLESPDNALGVTICFWSPERARDEFLKRWELVKP